MHTQGNLINGISEGHNSINNQNIINFEGIHNQAEQQDNRIIERNIQSIRLIPNDKKNIPISKVNSKVKANSGNNDKINTE